MDALLVQSGPNVRYLSGFTGSSGWLLVFAEASEGCVLVTDFRYREQAGQEVVSGVAVRVAEDGRVEELGRVLSERGGEAGEPETGPRSREETSHGAARIGFEADHATVRQLERLREAAPAVRWGSTEGLVETLRSVKDDGEVERIREAGAVATRALRETLDLLEEGMTEREVVAELEYRLHTLGSEGAAFETIVAGGPRSALPHARPGSRRLREGDLVLFDLGARVEGYCSDLTRTVVLGAARPWQRQVHEAVREAQRAALEVLAPGRPAREVDGAARAVLEEAGYGEAFGHSTGHGVGLEVHEEPSLSSRSEDLLREGHVVTVEPGAYLPDRGGVRIEDDVLIRAPSPRVLTEFPRELVEL